MQLMLETYTPPGLEPEPETMFVHATEIEQILDQPESVQGILHRRADRALGQITTTMPPRPGMERYEPGVRELDAADFEVLYDPTQPTIAIDLCNSYRGAEITALEAQRMRLEGGSSMNVVLIRGDVNCASLATFSGNGKPEGALEVTHGILVGPDGDVYYGKLPRAVYPSLLETNNCFLVEQCAKLGVKTLNSAEAIAGFEDKSTVGQIAARAGMTAPQRFTEGIISASWPQAGLVLKPSVGTGGGKGVVIARSKEQEYELANFHALLKHGGFKPLIEEFIDSYPLRDPNSNEPLAWNARVVVANGHLIDILIRAHQAGTPGNTSLGAVEFPFEQISAYLRSKRDADRLIAELQACGQQLAKALDAGIAGADIMIGQDLQRYLIEVNAGQFGALDEICELTDDYPRKRQPHHRLLDAWRSACNPETSRSQRGTVVSRQPTARDNISLFKGLHDIDREELFSYLPYDELMSRSHNPPFDAWLWICSRFARKNSNITNPDEAGVSQDLLKYTPIELISRAKGIVGSAERPYDFREALEILLDIRPGHPGLVSAHRLAVDSLYRQRR